MKNYLYAGVGSLALIAGTASAQSAADGAVSALGDAATAIGLVATAMVAAAAAGIVGRWVTAFLVK